MADYEKSYQIDFDVDKAIKSVERLERQSEKSAKDSAKAFAKYQKIIERNKIASEKVQVRAARASRVAAEKAYRETAKAAKAAAREQEKAAKRAEKAWQNFGNRVGRMGDYLTKRVTLPLVFIGGAAIKMSKDFREGMANVSTLLTVGEKQVESYGRAVQNMSKQFGILTGPMTEGLYQVVSALGEGPQNLAQLGQAAKAGKAGRADTASAILMLSAATKAYGDTSAEAMGKVSDLAFQTVKLGVTTFPELAASMGKVLPLAAALNTRQEELWGTMATLTGVTGNTAEVSTQLTSIYSAIMKPTKAMTKMAKAHGYETGVQMAKTEGLANMIRLMTKYTEGNEAALAKLLRRKEALVAVLALGGGQAEKYTEKLEAMENAAGSTDEAFRKQTRGVNRVGFAVDRARANIEVMTQRIGDKLLPVLERFLKVLEPIVDRIADMSEQEMGEMLTAAKWLILAGPILKVSGALLKAGSAISAFTGAGALTGMTRLTLSFKTLLGAVAPVTASLLAGVAAGKALKELTMDPELAEYDVATEEADTAIINARRKLASGQPITEADMNAVIAAQRKIGAAAPALTPENLISEVTPGESYRQRANRQEAELGALIDRMMPRYREAALSKAARGPVKVEPRVEAPFTVNINGTGANAKDIMRMTKREFSNYSKRLKGQLEGAAAQAAAAEQ